MVFLTGGRCYRGESAVEIVRALDRDAADYPHRGRPIRHFLLWSLDRIGGRVHPRELDLSGKLEDDERALNYLYLCDEYGVGELPVDRQSSPV